MSGDSRTVEIGDVALTLPHEVETVVEHGDLLVVLLDTLTPLAAADRGERDAPVPLADRNVLGFDSRGTLRWHVEPVSEGDPYVSLVDDDGRLRCGNWRGYDCVVDPSTGELTDVTFTK
ncbi:hypothetical protein [Halosimplex pelagicum]|uniref:Uncharacterized protein n=1 Tax=Halosimplex pelagicum TaxID=869886 RepID=A0A7D5PB20_9EURY|nr:hypothetical protein [Halosimplex pelagicum]QLH81922.1 hypothetical protein HZS54_09915 [Halosimplex pelagicum]